MELDATVGMPEQRIVGASGDTGRGGAVRTHRQFGPGPSQLGVGPDRESPAFKHDRIVGDEPRQTVTILDARDLAGAAFLAS